MTTAKKRAFAVAAHPDDIEFVMAGTLILLGQAGYELHYMNIANGCCGSTEHNASETARIREQEAMAAADQHRRRVSSEPGQRPGDFLRPRARWRGWRR